MKWITRNNITFERMPCIWLISRFIDPEPEFFFVPEGELDQKIDETKAILFDVEGACLAQSGGTSSFEKILFVYRFTNLALQRMSSFVGCGKLKKIEETLLEAGRADLLPLLSLQVDDAFDKLKKYFVVYDALYDWCKSQVLERKVVPPVDINRIL